MQQCMNNRYCNWILGFSCEALAQLRGQTPAAVLLVLVFNRYGLCIIFERWNVGIVVLLPCRNIITSKNILFLMCLPWFWWISPREFVETVSKRERGFVNNLFAGQWHWKKRVCIYLCTYCMRICTEFDWRGEGHWSNLFIYENKYHWAQVTLVSQVLLSEL